MPLISSPWIRPPLVTCKQTYGDKDAAVLSDGAAAAEERHDETDAAADDDENAHFGRAGRVVLQHPSDYHQYRRRYLQQTIRHVNLSEEKYAF